MTNGGKDPSSRSRKTNLGTLIQGVRESILTVRKVSLREMQKTLRKEV